MEEEGNWGKELGKENSNILKRKKTSSIRGRNKAGEKGDET